MSSPADIAIWGRVPPPIGGMAIHVSRLLPHLEAAGWTVRMYSLWRPGPPHPLVADVSGRRLQWYLGLLLGPGERVHYVLGGRATTRFAASWMGRLRRRAVVLRVGGESLRKTGLEGSWLERWMTRYAVRRASAVIGVNAEICDVAKRLGADPVRVHMIPGFIAPTDDGAHAPESVQRFAARCNPVLVSGGQIPAPDEDDIYGVDLLLDLMASLRPTHPQAGLVFYAYQIRTLGEEPLRLLQAEISRRALGDCIHVHPSDGEFWPVLKLADLMVRPTRTDGDSSAVREALHMGVPVVASDCAPRPESAVTFRSGDGGDLAHTVVRTLAQLDEHNRRLADMAVPDHAERVVSVLRGVLGER